MASNAPDWVALERAALEFAEESKGERPSYLAATAVLLAVLELYGMVRVIAHFHGLPAYQLTTDGRARLVELREGEDGAH